MLGLPKMGRTKREPLLARAVAHYLVGMEEPAARLRPQLAEPVDADLLLEGRWLELLALAAPPGRLLFIETRKSESHAVLRARAGQEAVWVGHSISPPFGGEQIPPLAIFSEAPLEWLARNQDPMGLAVVGEAVRSRRQLLDSLLERMVVGGFLLFLGELAHLWQTGPEVDRQKPEIRQAEQFHHYLRMHPQLLASMLPIGRGVAVAIKRKVTVRELGGPFG